MFCMRNPLCLTGFVLVLQLTSCGAAESSLQVPPEPLVRLPFLADYHAGPLDLSGTVVHGLRWRDAAGENMLVLTETGAIPTGDGDASTFEEQAARDAGVRAFHYLVQGDTLSLHWQASAFERGCAYDLSAHFRTGATFVRDQDGDGIGEVTVVYELGCRSNVSGNALTLLMHEGEAEYRIRGWTVLLPHEEGGQEVEVESSFEGLSQDVVAFLHAVWRQQEVIDAFRQL